MYVCMCFNCLVCSLSECSEAMNGIHNQDLIEVYYQSNDVTPINFILLNEVSPQTYSTPTDDVEHFVYISMSSRLDIDRFNLVKIELSVESSTSIIVDVLPYGKDGTALVRSSNTLNTLYISY